MNSHITLVELQSRLKPRIAINILFKLGSFTLVLLVVTKATSAEIIGNSVTEFSGTQGANGWQYGYGDSASFTAAGSYNAVGNMFGYGSPGVWTGIGNIRHVAEGSHPNTAGGSHESLRRWTSDFNGTIKVTGTLAKFDPVGTGIIGGVRVNGSNTIFNQFVRGTDNVGVNYTTYLHVNVGDTLDFFVNANGNNNNDSTRFTAQIATVSPHTQVFDAAKDFNPSAVANISTSPWQYVNLTGINDLSDSRSGIYPHLTTSVSSGSSWEGVTGIDVLKTPARLPVVAKNTSLTTSLPFGGATTLSGAGLAVHPDATNGVGIGWLAPEDGFVDVDGFLKRLHNNTLGDGVQWFLDLNSTLLDSGTIGNAVDASDTFSISNLAVNAGDRLWLGVLAGSTGDFAGDFTQASMTVAFTQAPEPASIMLWLAVVGIAAVCGCRIVANRCKS